MKAKTCFILSLISLSLYLFYGIYFNHHFLLPITRLEQKLSHPVYFTLSEAELHPSPKPPCHAIPVVHGGNSRGGAHPLDSREGVLEAIEDKIPRMEVDLTIFRDEIILEHNSVHLPMGSSVEDFKKQGHYPMTLDEFFKVYVPRAEMIVFDFKEVLTDVPNALSLLKKHAFDPTKHLFVGLNCDWIKILQKEFHMPAGCEYQGVIVNWLLGFDIWSADWGVITSLQLKLNQILNLKKLFFTFPEPEDVANTCGILNPDVALLEYFYGKTYRASGAK